MNLTPIQFKRLYQPSLRLFLVLLTLLPFLGAAVNPAWAPFAPIVASSSTPRNAPYEELPVHADEGHGTKALKQAVRRSPLRTARVCFHVLAATPAPAVKVGAEDWLRARNTDFPLTDRSVAPSVLRGPPSSLQS